MLEILQKENKILREKAEELKIKDIKSLKIKKLIKEMQKTLASEKDGVALAAPQVGESIQLFIVSKKIFGEEENKKEIFIFINPKIIKASKKKEWLEEGCLSFKGIYGKVERYTNCTIEALNEKGEKVSRGAGGLLSQIFQHEIDHLNGILFIDKAKDLAKITL